jgi:hypothetical protein
MFADPGSCLGLADHRVESVGGLALPPQQVLTGPPMPLDLPGASFYDFPASNLAVLPDGRLAVGRRRKGSQHPEEQLRSAAKLHQSR